MPVSTDLSKLSDVVKMKLLKKMCMTNWLKKLMLFRLLILVNYLRKADYSTRIAEIKKKIPEHRKHITTPRFNKLIQKILQKG